MACYTIYYIHCYNHLSTYYLGVYIVSDYKNNVSSWRGASVFAALAEGLSSGPKSMLSSSQLLVIPEPGDCIPLASAETWIHIKTIKK